MRVKRILKSIPVLFFLLCVAMTLCSCEVAEMGTLPELSKPYLGVYRCESISLGGEDMTEKFQSIELELGYNGSFSLSYKDERGRKGEYHGSYETDGEEITFTALRGIKNTSFTFPMEKGKIYVDYPLGPKLLHAVFAMP